MPARSIRFLLNGTPTEVDGVSPQTTLLEWLREQQRCTGTKEGCAEGDCGACTIVLGEPHGDGLRWQPVNACIRLLPSVHGKAVFTVEGLKGRGGELHPLQQALVDCHGSQCGFCTPGFVMSLFALYKNARDPDREAIHEALSGNLCRCTGYRPIVAAAQRMGTLPEPDDWRGPGVGADDKRIVGDDERRLASTLRTFASDEALDYEGHGQRWIAPASEDALAQACTAHPDARLCAGTTDVALWITKGHRALGTLIYTRSAIDLARVRHEADRIVIGAAASLADAFEALDGPYPELHEAWVRFGSPPIRSSGTLGGNIANGSPIGDSMPALIALGASLELRCGSVRRELPLEAFYLAYQKTARVPGEFVTRIFVPMRADGLLLRAYKVSKRFDQDISAVFACFALRVVSDRIVEARVGCGGVAPVPSRARKTESVLSAQTWTRDIAERAAQALEAEFTPIDDMRASAQYRRRVLGNLMRRCWLETAAQGTPARVHALGSLAAASG
jgi:xanthine dehydrogenase small subunit